MQMEKFYRTSYENFVAQFLIPLCREIFRKKSILKRYLGASDTFYDYLLTLMFAP